MLKVGSPACDDATYRARIPTQIRTLPATSISISFIAPYSLVRKKVPKSVLLPHTPISRYIGSTAKLVEEEQEEQIPDDEHTEHARAQRQQQHKKIPCPPCDGLAD